ncbi:MAG: SGNH/GDSL hydrolase family protein [Candidatus Faecousia sp.]|nr:SGNH/GDSL hydrolase family protein [Candidatus Faecousia sp.]
MKNTQNALRAAAFLLGLILLLTGITWVFLPKNNTKEAGFDDTPCYGFLAERTHSLDVVFLGNSVPLFSVAPAVIWKEQGIPCYVCAQTSTALVDADRFLQDFLKTQSPKVVMLETDAVFWESDASQWEKQQLAQRFPLLRFHENWKSVALSQLIRPIHYTNRVDSEGYRFTAETVPWTKGDYVDFSAAPKPAPALSPEILKHIRSLCDENGARLILFTAPNPKWYTYGKNRTLTQMAEELGVPYIDLNLKQQELGLDWYRDTYDGGDHMNWRGAQKVSRFLGQYLAQKGLLTDQRDNPAYADWNRRQEAFLTTTENPQS